MGVTVGEDRSRKRFDPMEVKNKEPGTRYLWANKKLVEENKEQGWEIVNRSTSRGHEKTSDDPRSKAQEGLEGTRQVRDTILMKMPEEKAREQFDKPVEELTRRRTHAFSNAFKEEARREGLTPIDETKDTRG
jgi:hypothetical protein